MLIDQKILFSRCIVLHQSGHDQYAAEYYGKMGIRKSKILKTESVQRDCFYKAVTKLVEHLPRDLKTIGFDRVTIEMIEECMACKVIKFGLEKMIITLPSREFTVKHPITCELKKSQFSDEFFQLIQFAMHTNDDIISTTVSNFFQCFFHYLRHYNSSFIITRAGVVHGLDLYALFDTVDLYETPRGIFLPHLLEYCVKQFEYKI